MKPTDTNSPCLFNGDPLIDLQLCFDSETAPKDKHLVLNRKYTLSPAIDGAPGGIKLITAFVKQLKKDGFSSRMPDVRIKNYSFILSQLKAAGIILSEMTDPFLYIRNIYKAGKETFGYHVCCNPYLISDVEEYGRKEVILPVIVQICNSEGVFLGEDSFDIQLKFTRDEKAWPQPRMEIRTLKSIPVHQPYPDVEVAELIIDYPSAFVYDGDASITIRIDRITHRNSELPVPIEVWQNIFKKPVIPNQWGGIVRMERPDNRSITIGPLPGNNIHPDSSGQNLFISVPVCFDFSDVEATPNPIDKEEYVIDYTCIYTYEDYPEIIKKPESYNKIIQVNMDNSKPDLRIIRKKGPFLQNLLSENGPIHLQPTYLKINDKISADVQFVTFTNLILTNKAAFVEDDEQGRSFCLLYPDRCSYKVELYDINGRELDASLIDPGEEHVSLEDIFRLEDTLKINFKDSIRKNACFKGGESIEFFLRLQRGKIRSVSRDGLIDSKGRFEVKCTIHVCYQNGQTPGTSIEEADIVFIIPIIPDYGDQWLCLDFGTSAVVALYGDQLLDLNSRKKELLAEMGLPLYEDNTSFLSSHIFYRDSFPVNGEYPNCTVMLSPTQPMVEQFSNNLLPCLKLFVGRYLLPNYNNFNHISYVDENGENITLQKFEQQPGRLLSDIPILQVNYLFSHIYETLFRYYISPVVSGQRNMVSKFIATVPNTYRPSDIEILIGIAQKVFPHLTDTEQIVTISESEAVACYYHRYRDALLGDEVTNRRHLWEKEGEYVLAYDMGAGTLDITYFKVNAQGISILGSIGCNYAGNYLDYALGMDLIEKHIVDNSIKQDSKEYLFLQGLIALEPVSSDSLLNITREQFKEYVKRVKEGDYDRCFLLPEQVFTTSGRILKADASFFDISTAGKGILMFYAAAVTDLFESFFTTLNFTKGSVPLHSLMFTGRATQVSNLKQNVRNVLALWQKRITGMANFRIVIPGKTDRREADSQSLKNAVIHGASWLTNMRHDFRFFQKGLYARYGVVFHSRGSWQFTTILSPQSEKVESTGILYKGSTVLTDISDSQIYIVRTFDKEPEKVWKAIMEGKNASNKELEQQEVNYLTVLYSSEISYVHVSIEIELTINSNNDMTVSIRNLSHPDAAEATAEFAQDVPEIGFYNNMSFRKSIWPKY